jgi:hypothetical protein
MSAHLTNRGLDPFVSLPATHRLEAAPLRFNALVTEPRFDTRVFSSFPDINTFSSAATIIVPTCAIERHSSQAAATAAA